MVLTSRLIIQSLIILHQDFLIKKFDKTNEVQTGAKKFLPFLKNLTKQFKRKLAKHKVITSFNHHGLKHYETQIESIKVFSMGQTQKNWSE